MSEVVKIGLIGASSIAPSAVIGPARDNADVVVQAIAARDPARARSYAEAHGIPEPLDSYEALVRHPDIDAVYIGLPAALNEDWVLAAVENGKHVLCEKPFALNAHQAHWMFTIAERRRCVVMEAFHDIHHPLFQGVLDATDRMLDGPGRLGRLKRIEARLDAPVMPDGSAFRSDPLLGGGALYDLGTYCVHWCRLVARGEPRVIEATQRLNRLGADQATRARLIFPDGIEAVIDCDMEAPFQARLRVEGERGTLTVDNPLQPIHGHRFVIEVDGERLEKAFPLESTYAFQLRAFVSAVRRSAAPRPGPADTVAQMQALDAIRETARRPTLAGSIVLREPVLNAGNLTSRTWMFGRTGQMPFSPYVRLLPDGRLAGHAVEMERRWAVEDGKLVFFDWLDRRSTVFGEVRAGADGRLLLIGDIAGSAAKGEHQLAERAPVGRLCPADEGAVLDVRPSRRRRNLLVIRAGPQSLHARWARDITDADRNWDLCISWYGDEADYRALDDGEYRTLQNDCRKFPALYSLFHTDSSLFDYETVALFDDDLEASWSAINELFALFKEFGLALAQPALAPGSFYAYELVRQKPDSILRYTTFVESMAPLMSRDTLLACVPTFDQNTSGFGIDNIWPKLIGEPRNGIAVIDKVGVVHTRPTGGSYSVDRAIGQGNEFQRRYAAPSRVRELGQVRP